MAQPSSSHRDRERERERSERSSRHHHHRTISSTTLLLVLSLVLAVLAVMLSLPSSREGAVPGANPGDPASQGILGYLTPKRSQALIARESNVAVREAEVARREAELLAGAPGGVLPPTPSCAPCPTVVEKITEPPLPAQTVIKEVVKEESLTPPGWWDQARVRAEDILDRELKIAEREREISRREEAVNRREHDASRRETWIMEQLVAFNDEEPFVEEEVVYEPAIPGGRRKPKVPVGYQALPPPLVFTETAIEVATETRTVTQTQHHTYVPPAQTVTVPPPANTRRAASPIPEMVSSSPSTTHSPRTTAVEYVIEETFPEEPVEPPVTVLHAGRRQPKAWWGGW